MVKESPPAPTNIGRLARDIAFFVPDLSGGGAERVMAALASRFQQDGYQVDLVLLKKRGIYLETVDPGVRIVELGVNRTVLSLPALVRYLRRNRPCVLLCALDHANIVGVLARQLSRVSLRLILSVHCQLSSNLTDSSRWRDRLLPHLIRRWYPAADALVAVSQGVAEELRDLLSGRRTVHVIYNPVVSDELAERMREEVNEAWFVESRRPIVLGVGRMSAQKDFATLIRAFAELRKKRPASLVLLGEGELRGDLEALVQEYGLNADVKFAGFVNNPYRFMKHADVLVLSSRYEGFGNVLVEALACGTPVVSTDCPSGPAEILDYGRYGTLVPVGDAPAMAAAIESVLVAEIDRDILTRRAQAFHIDKISREYRAICFPNI